MKFNYGISRSKKVKGLLNWENKSIEVPDVDIMCDCCFERIRKAIRENVPAGWILEGFAAAPVVVCLNND